jgi:hypothetical protein
MPPALDSRSIRRYLLGDLPEADAIALELQYFADPEALEQVSAVENDLVDDHAAGRLEPAERARFDQHYLASPRHRRRAAIAAGLRRSVTPTAQVPRTVRVAALAREARRRPVRTVHLALAAGVVAVVVALWLIMPPSPPGGSQHRAEVPPGPSVAPEPRVESLPPTPQPDKDIRPVTAIFAISSLLPRGSGDGAGLRVPHGVDEVLLRLDGEPAPGPLTYTLRTVEGEVLTSGRAGPAPRPHVATVRLPAAQVRPGDYLLTLTPVEGGEPLGQYFFRVLRR